jgi:archaellum component FlaF (FlaF/FlaG flagellin family)
MLPGLSVEAITSGVQVSDSVISPYVKLDDTVITRVTLKNNGTAATSAPFKVTLYANGVLVSEASVSAAINPGTSAEVTMPAWTANLLPTGYYTLTAYADSELKMNLLAERCNCFWSSQGGTAD